MFPSQRSRLCLGYKRCDGLAQLKGELEESDSCCDDFAYRMQSSSLVGWFGFGLHPRCRREVWLSSPSTLLR